MNLQEEAEDKGEEDDPPEKVNLSRWMFIDKTC